MDDLTVQACVSRIFSDGFESGGTSLWFSTIP